MTRRLAVNAALLLLTACGAAATGDRLVDRSFTPARLLAGTSQHGATPAMVIATSGREVISWVTAPTNDQPGGLQFEVREADGSVHQSFLTDPLGAIEPSGEAPPQITSGEDGRIYALYLVGKDVGARYPVSALRLASSSDGGLTWSAPVSVNEGDTFGGHNFHGISAGPGGGVHVTWLSSGDTTRAWVRSSTDGGMTWNQPRPIAPLTACPCCRTASATAPDGRVYAAWRSVSATDVRDIVVASSTDGGLSWSEPVRPRSHNWQVDACPVTGPSLRVDQSGVVHLAWWTGKEGEAGLWYGRSQDQGSSWQVQPIDTAQRAVPMHPQLAVDAAGAVVIAWDGGAGPRPVIRLRASTDHGQTFGAARLMSDPSLAATFPVVGLAGDSITLAWTQIADSAYRELLMDQAEPVGHHERMKLPEVGSQTVVERRGVISSLAGSEQPL